MLNNKREAIQFMRFCTVGLGNTAVDLTAFFVLTLSGVPYLLAQTLSYSVGVVNSFFLNRKWTFRITHRTNILEVVRFAVVNGFSLLISSGMLFILHDANHTDLWLSKLIATGGGIVVNFIGSRLWVFTEEPSPVSLSGS